MKSMIRKTTFREIRQSFGRYMAMFSIVALGVGFFAGLKVTKPAMVATTQGYLEEKQFYDFRLISTVGFDEINLENISMMEDIRTAAGAVSFDIIYEDASGNSGVMKAHSITEGVNELEVLAGRMPENANECVVDSTLFTEDQIGNIIVLSNENEDEDLERFSQKQYEIVGIVQSSYYIQFERGNTSLGNGKINGFMYLLPEGFDVDYFTEIFVKFDKDFDMYSDEYEAYIDAKEQVWKDMCAVQADLRYESLLADAKEELADGKQELADKKAEAEEELADAKQKLADAYTELTEGVDKIADAKRELADAQKEIAENEQKLIDDQKEIVDNEATLIEKEKELKDGQEAWDSNNYIVEEKWAELKVSQTELDAQLSALLEQKAQIDAIPAPYLTPELSQAKMALEAGLSTIATYQAQIDAGRVALEDADRQLASALKELADGRIKIEDGKKELADAKEEVADGLKKIADAKVKLADGKKELEEKQVELEDGWLEYEDGLKEYEDGIKEFDAEIADAEAKIADAEEEIADVEKPDTYVLGRDTNVGYVCFESDSNIVEDISNVFPIFFFLVAALVCITTMNRMVEEQRTQIGVLKALGYGESTIMFKYMFYSGSAAVMGCIFGFGLGTFLFPKVIWSAYGMMYNMISLNYVFQPSVAILCLAISLLCSVGTTWLSCHYEFSEVAAELMRPKAPKAGKRVFLEYIPFIWKRLKFLKKVSVRNILRYKKRFFMMIIGISGCTALLLAAFGIQDSIADVATMQFSEIQTYDMSVVLKDGNSVAGRQALEKKLENNAESYQYIAEKSMDLYANGQMKSVELVMTSDIETFGEFFDLHTSKGAPVDYPENGEIVICKFIADTYDLSIGDSIYLQDEDLNRIDATISGICENFVYNYVYLNAQSYEQQMGEAVEFKTALVNLNEDSDAHNVAASIIKLSTVSNTTINSDVLERFDGMMKSLDYVVLLVILCAAALAFIVLYNLTNINITERIREIATIKVLGFYKKETSQYVFRENTVLTFIGSMVGLVLGVFLHKFIMYEIKIDMVNFAVRILPMSYVYSVLLTFVFAWIVNRIMTVKLEKINMAESLKSVD